MPRISVVIPTYNCAHLLGDAIESVRIQDWGELEIVVVDDGSTDGTVALLSSLGGPDLVVVKQENCGPAAARNAGIRRASGDWIAFLDADDLWLPGKLRGQVNALCARPNAAFSFTDALVRNSSGAETVVAVPDGDGDILWHLLAGPRFGVGSVLIRRDRLDRIGLFDPALRMGEDWDMWLRLAASYEGCGVRSVLVVYRRCSEGPPKYSSELLESCTLRVLARLFSGPETSPGLRKLRSRVYGWHYSVLAKSHLKQGRVWPALRIAAQCVTSHPHGFRFLAGRWGRNGRYPSFTP
jgi:hypothetical protein